MRNFKKSTSIFVTLFMMLSLFLGEIPVRAEVAGTSPMISFVGLSNNPALAGTPQQFYLTASGYSGDVQYQIFYIDANNPNRTDPLRWTKVQDWTTPTNATVPFTYNVPALSTGDYSFAIRVKRAGFTSGMTLYSNAAGEYDDAYAFNYSFKTSTSLDVSSIAVSKTSPAVGEKVTITGLKGGSSYRVFSFNEASQGKWLYVGAGTSTVDWTPSLAGSYILDVQILSASNTVLGWKLLPVNVGATTQGAAAGTVTSANATSSTTVEVTFASAVQNINTTDFTFNNGLTVSNAAVKQGTDNVVVLTTSAQTGGAKYSLSYRGAKVADVTGVSSVIPTSIRLTTTSTSLKVGTNSVLTADIGQKTAGVKVTFNIVSSTNSNIIPDVVAEVPTDANGIASYSYTRYVPTTDTIYVYPSGAPTVRDNGTVFWGTNAQLTLTASPTTTTVSNDTAQVYSFTLLDPNGNAVQTSTSGTRVWVTFAENIDANLSNDTTATVDGVRPYQTADTRVAKEVTTDSNGSGTFTVSGNTTTATPIIYITQNYSSTTDYPKLENTNLQLKAPTIQFVNALQGYKITVDKTSAVTAASAATSGSSKVKYIFTVTKADGTVASGVNLVVSFAELLDSSLTTNTSAQFVEATTATEQQKRIYTTDSVGKAEVNIWSPVENTVATPEAWIDLNGTQDMTLQAGEPYVLAPAISFYAEKVTSATVGYSDTYVAVTGDLVYTENVDAQFTLKNQSNQTLSTAADTINTITWTINNTGSNDIITTIQAVNGTINSITGKTDVTPGVTTVSSPVTIRTGSSVVVVTTASGVAVTKSVLRLQAPNVDQPDTTKKEIGATISAVGATGANKTYTGSFVATVRYAPKTTSVTGKVAGFLKAKGSFTSAYTPGYASNANGGLGTTNTGTTDAKEAIVRVLVEVDGMAGRYVWVDTSYFYTNPYGDDTNHTNLLTANNVSDNVYIGTDTTFDDNNYTALSVAIPADKQLSDYISVGDKVQLTATKFKLANIQ